MPKDDVLPAVQITPPLSNVNAKTDIKHFTWKFHIRADYIGNKDYFYLSVCHLYQYPLSAAGYVLKPTGVSRMLAFLTCSTHAVISTAHNLTTFQANLTLKIQTKRFNSHFVHAPIQASSAPLSRSKLNVSKLPKNKHIFGSIVFTAKFTRLYNSCTMLVTPNAANF